MVDEVDQHRFDNQRSDYLTAQAACQQLQVKRATLYAYASRGLIRSVAGPRGRARLYDREDVERLRARSRARSGHAPVAAGALRWGEPVLESAITAISGEGPRYRGQLAVELARRDHAYESVAELLWSGELPECSPAWEPPSRADLRLTRALRGAWRPDTTALPALLTLLPTLAASDAQRFDLPDAAEHTRARRALQLMAVTLAWWRGARSFARPEREPYARLVARALGAAAPAQAERAVDRALIVSADHELNVSTFAARVVASSGADLYSCLAAALAGLSGPLHGGACDRVEALLDEVRSPRSAERVIAARTQRGQHIPGFGHPLYPSGDPRAVPLLELALAAPDPHPTLTSLLAIWRAMRRLGRPEPTIDFALVAVALALGMPRGSASALFALGRSAGWVAHVLEQRRAGFLLRPRALYVGP